MAKAGKKYQEACKLLEAGKVYSAEEAVELVKKTATAKFDETIELHVRLGVDPKYADQQVRGAMVLPHGTGKSKRVLVFAKGAKVDEAEAAGADFVGSDEIVTKIQGGWVDFDVAVATPDMMGTVGRLGKILGPRGLMPNRKNILVIRDKEGQKAFGRLDITDPAIFTSPYFYLQQNDVVYVEPNKAKKRNARYSAAQQYTITVFSSILSAISVITTVILAITNC